MPAAYEVPSTEVTRVAHGEEPIMSNTKNVEAIEVRTVAAQLAEFIEGKPEFRPGLSTAEIFELNYRYFREFQSSDFRKNALAEAKATKAAEAAARKAEREEAAKARLVEERAKLEAKLAALAAAADDEADDESNSTE
jgi:hypothetical protein